MKAQNSLGAILANIESSQDNILKIMNAFNIALTTNANNISVELTNSDGTIGTYNIPTNTTIYNELNLLKESFRNVIGLSSDGKARLVNVDGDFRELIVSDYLPAIPLKTEDMTISQNIDISTNSVIENLISPLTQLEIKLNKTYNNIGSVYITKIITDKLDGLNEGITFGEAKRILSKDNRDFEVVSFFKEIKPKQARYYGDFIVNKIKFENQVYEVTLESLKYSDNQNLFENTKQLIEGDVLVNDNGSSIFEVTNVSYEYNLIKLKHISGVGAIELNKKLYLKDNTDMGVVVQVPIRLYEKSLIFIEVVDKHTNEASNKSTSLIFDSNTYNVNDNGIIVTFNEYFSAKVSDIGRHIESLVRENNIPSSFGITPTKPIVKESDLNVIQINKHLTNTSNADKIKKASKEKQQLINQIAVANQNISDLTSKLNDSNYTNNAKFNADVTERNRLINDKKQKTELLDSLTRDIKTMLEESSEASISPKYRVRGFWEVQKPIINEFTNPQHIVQYDVRYRYVSNVGNTANSQEMIYTNGDNQVSAIFSSWNNLKTPPLEKVVDKDGKVSWVNNDPTNSDKQSINSLDIPITYGESVEVQIRSVSEAGFPTSPIKSDWSDLVRVDFPIELLQETTLATIQKRNNEDLYQVRVMQEFENQGITEHILTSFKEGDKLFVHRLKDIASGKVTTEQKQIDAETYINSLENRLNLLDEIVNRRFANLSVQILDGDLVEHDVTNNSTINLFAGNYLDDVDISDNSNFGTIVTKKFFLKLINRNAQTVEILSLNSGVKNQPTLSSKYNNIPIYLNGSNSITPQLKGQIFYQRNKNIDSTSDLYVLDTNKLNTKVDISDIDYTSTNASKKNVISLNGSNIDLVAIKKNASLSGYVAMTTMHPSYLEMQSSGNNQALINEYNRIVNFNNLYKENGVQNANKNDLIIKYTNSDKYLVGRTTCGSTLYMALNDIQSFQVDGIDTSSAKEIYSGENDSILIPIEFQYRMCDALGNPNGISNTSINTNFEYNKKLGVDLLIGGKLFSFDLNITSRFRSTSISRNNIGGGNQTQFNTQLSV